MEDLLQKHRPNLSESSVKTYCNCIKILYKNYQKISDKFKDKPITLSFLQNYSRVIHSIKDEPLTTKKSRLACIVVFLKITKTPEELVKKYQTEMTKVADEYQNWLKTQTKSKKQSDNWITQNEVDKIINDLYETIKDFKNNETISDEQYNKLQVYTVLRLLSDINVRNEFAEIYKVNESTILDDTKNYIIKEDKFYKIILNKYKTKKFLGTKEYIINKPLSTVLNILFKFNKSNFLLTKRNRTTMLGTNGLSKMLIAFFKKTIGKSISTSMLRHINISEELKDKPTIVEDEIKYKQIENKYLHNKKQNDLYRKID